jgi:hypothetical protein
MDLPGIVIGSLIYAAMLLGALVFGASAIARLAVKYLDESVAGDFLRPFWVLYHKTAMGGGLGSVFLGSVMLGFTDLALALPIFCASIFMTCSFIGGYITIPMINAAKDASQDARFSMLHRLDVGLVSAGLLLNSCLVWALVQSL